MADAEPIKCNHFWVKGFFEDLIETYTCLHCKEEMSLSDLRKIKFEKITKCNHYSRMRNPGEVVWTCSGCGLKIPDEDTDEWFRSNFKLP